MDFWKYHALGNDYVVLAGAMPLAPEAVRRICARHHGLGADGILLDVGGEPAALRIFNPDGSSAEKSGNGLRIFARYLHDRGRVAEGDWFPVSLGAEGGEVTCRVTDAGRRVTVEMGRASFDAADIPVPGLQGDVVARHIEVDGRDLEYSAVTVGNPHCVLVRDFARAEEAKTLGPLLEEHPAFPNRTNVQFAQVIDPHRIYIEIWERGAGYTLASGTSSCAAAAVCCRLGLVASPVTVEMPGGALHIDIRDDWTIRMEGPVAAIAHGTLSSECVDGDADGDE